MDARNKIKTNKLTCKIVIHSFDDKILEVYLLNLKKLASKIGILNMIGPIPLPNKTKRWTVLRSPHIDKKSREQFEWVIHKRYFELRNSPPSLQRIFLHYLREQVPIGIGIEIKTYTYMTFPF